MTALILGIGIPLFYVLGWASAVYALYNAKQAQSTTAWILALVFMPFVSVPLYWGFGRNKFSDYADALVQYNEQTKSLQADLNERLSETCACPAPDQTDARSKSEVAGFEYLADSTFTTGNAVTLLINGEAVFDSIFDSIDSAEQYVLVQFYTIHGDDIGNRLKDKLLAARERGVAVYLLYDYIGSMSLPDKYIEQLKAAGIEVSQFSGDRRLLGRFRLNFRNHRKIVVVDGHTGFTGGLNVGDEYLGRDKSIGNWRDTHARINGPATLSLQLSFAKDWFFATNSTISDMHWLPTCNEQGADVLISSSGPHETLKNCGLLYAHLISSAEKRVWIATPYLVPDGRVIGALQLAAMRGVDVRILVPRATDNPLFKFVPYAFIEDVLRTGGKIYFYEKDFMHQKVILVDDSYAVVSTANFDNRSFFLNFEISCVVRDKGFCQETERMLEADLGDSTEIFIDTMENRTMWEHLATQATRLLAPIL